jgi:hypothetical protein
MPDSTAPTPYNKNRMIQDAATLLRQDEVARQEPTGQYSKESPDAIKSYTMEEAKSLEIVPFDNANPFGELGQTFNQHFTEIQQSAEIIQLEKDKPTGELVVGAKQVSKETVGDLLRSVREKSEKQKKGFAFDLNTDFPDFLK